MKKIAPSVGYVGKMVEKVPDILTESARAGSNAILLVGLNKRPSASSSHQDVVAP